MTYISPKSWTFAVNTSYSPYYIQYQSKSKSGFNLRTSINKSFFKDKLSISLSASDILNTSLNNTSTFNSYDYQQVSRNQRKTRNITLSAKYHFGKKFFDFRRMKGFKGD